MQIQSLREVVVARLGFSCAEWARLAGFYGFIVFLHVCGWSLFLYYSSRYESLVGLGFAAYMLGLRHAFDADHIAAVDDTVRFLSRKEKAPLGIGFFFSLGHATVVFALAVVAIMAATLVRRSLPDLHSYGSFIGTGISGIFLWLIGILNLGVLLNVLRAWRDGKNSHQGHVHLDEMMAQCGFFNRLFGRRLQRFIKHSWQMYPLGVLFGFGFDTASEIGVLAMSAGASAGSLPIQAALSLPILFAAGMCAMDTTDGVLMSKAYSWAFVNPARKVFYNITITSLSIAVAIVIGTIELLQVLIEWLRFNGPVARFVSGLDFAALGYVIVGMFVLAWAGSAALWKLGRFHQRYRAAAVHVHVHEHSHANALRHVHEHFH